MRVLQQIFRSPLGVTAALSVALLFAVSVSQISSLMQNNQQALAFVATPAAQTAAADGADWQQEMTLLGLNTENNPAATSTTDSIAMIGHIVIAEMVGQYAGLQDRGTYTTETGQNASADIAANLRANILYKTYSTTDFKTDTDVSYDRMLTYRGDLRAALAPLLQNTGAELELYGKYIETADTKYLGQLSSAAANYRAAAQGAAALTIPRDAVNYHKDILNAMEKFSATLDKMATHAADPLASAALLRTFNQAETDMYTSFNALSNYYGQKTP
ncbi:MAG: hypothetical protein AAB927_03205 [Patescibacteria group bacterium]